MRNAQRFRLVMVTAPDQRTARGLAQSVLAARLAACVNLVPSIESHYWWRGKLEAGMEILLIIKTSQAKLNQLERMILARHPYDTAEFLVLPIEAGSGKYLDWLGASLGKKTRLG